MNDASQLTPLAPAKAADGPSRSRRFWAWVGLPLWLALTIWGAKCLWALDNQPAVEGVAPTQWPAESHLSHRVGEPTLVVFLHPKCACSEATIEELKRVLAGSPRGQAVAVFIHPAGVADDWAQTQLRREAEKIPRLRVCEDRDGREARTFGAKASGRTLLYNEAGRLIYDGGLTASRGHMGENAGSDSLLALLNGAQPSTANWPVFGCPLQAAANPGKEGR